MQAMKKSPSLLIIELRQAVDRRTANFRWEYLANIQSVLGAKVDPQPAGFTIGPPFHGSIIDRVAALGEQLGRDMDLMQDDVLRIAAGQNPLWENPL